MSSERCLCPLTLAVGVCTCDVCKRNKNKDEPPRPPIVPPANRCRCKKDRCVGKKCSCFVDGVGCTSKCKCNNCTNSHGVKPTETNNEAASQGSGTHRTTTTQ